MTRSRVVGWLALAAVVVAGVSGLLPWSSDHLVVLAGVVVRPPGVGGVLLGVAGLLGLAHLMLRPAALPPLRRSIRVLRRLGCTALVIAAVASVGNASIADIVSRYLILEQASASGCRVVVDERSFLLLGSGVIHVLPAGAVLTHPVSDYIADDGYQPFSLGTYQLTWNGDDAVLIAPGDQNAPVDPPVHVFTCH